jgi:hypothetical protein
MRHRRDTGGDKRNKGIWPADCRECFDARLDCGRCPVSEEDRRPAAETCGDVRELDGGREMPLPMAQPAQERPNGGALGLRLADVPFALVGLVGREKKPTGGGGLF